MKSMLAVLAVAVCWAFSFASAADMSIAEFEQAMDDGLRWRVVNDGVMGGLSEGNVAMTATGELIFSGTLSLENNGGFSSIRSDRVDLDLSGADGLALRVKGDGRTYQVRLSTDSTYRGREMTFMAEFPTTRDEWVEVRVPFGNFVGTWFGRTLPWAKFDPSNVIRVGILLAEKQPGGFDLSVDYIRTFGGGSVGTNDSVLLADPGPATAPKDRLSALEMIESAISTGVPVFNEGRHAETAAIYEQCLVRLSDTQYLDPGILNRLKMAIGYGRALDDPTERAWHYRRNLDATVRYLLNTSD